MGESMVTCGAFLPISTDISNVVFMQPFFSIVTVLLQNASYRKFNVDYKGYFFFSSVQARAYKLLYYRVYINLDNYFGDKKKKKEVLFLNAEAW
jgi:hypothetical protein